MMKLQPLRTTLAALTWALLFTTSAQAAYDVTIAASGSSSGGAWVGNTWTPSASGSTVLASEIATHLGSGATVIATTGAGADNGDIVVNGAIAWSANLLTLNAQRSIAIKASASGSGTAQLTLQYGQGAVAAGNSASYTLSNGAKVSLPAGANFISKLGSDGATAPWTVITGLGVAGDATVAPGVMTLQGMNTGLAGKYVLGADIDASATSGWNAGAGFAPVGFLSGLPTDPLCITCFNGVFDGLGHTISGLYINRPTPAENIGLFGSTDNAVLRNVGVTNASVTGGLQVGVLAGRTDNTAVGNSYASGTVAAYGNAGGLIGKHLVSTQSALIDSHADVAVTATVPASASIVFGTGGLVGVITQSARHVNGGAGRGDAAIINSYATGNATGNNNTGGLVGLFQVTTNTTVDNCYATGNVTGYDYTGGLIGGFDRANGMDWPVYMTPRPEGAIISNSHATGAVSGHQGVAGLVGGEYLPGGYFALGYTGIHDPTAVTVRNSYATGNVTGINEMGGLVGYVNDTLTISDSYAVGNVTGTRGTLLSESSGVDLMSYIGGLAGGAIRAMTISNSHATGNVTGTGYFVGGLIGRAENGSSITNTYATGNVSGNGSYVGGLAGVIRESTVSGSAATGNVIADMYAGGLIGQAQTSAISDCYATGNVNQPGTNFAGGLIGIIASSGGGVRDTTVTRSYAAGAVSARSGTGGGLIGLLFDPNGAVVTVSASYWNTSATTVGYGDNTGGSFVAVGKTSAELKQLATFAGWNIDDAGGTGKVWRIYAGNTYPLLRTFLTPLTATAGSGTKTFDGSTATTLGVSYSPTPNAHLLGTASVVAAGASVGSQTARVSGLYSDQPGYDITLVNGTVTINAVPVPVVTPPVAPITPPAPTITPTIAPLVVALPGTAGLPLIVNMGDGEGPSFMDGLVSLLSAAVGQPLRYAGQNAQGTVTLSGYNGGNLAFIPHTFQTNDTRANGIYALGDGRYQVVWRGQSLIIAPALVRLDQLLSLFPGVSVNLGDNGVITATINGVIHVVQPGVAVQLDSATGNARLAMGADGTWHFIDALGNNQTLYPAFADVSALRNALQGLDLGVTLSIQLDGTASIVFKGQHYTLVPDLTLSTVPAARVGQYWWQDSATRFWVANNQPPGTAQGFTVKP